MKTKNISRIKFFLLFLLCNAQIINAQQAGGIPYSFVRVMGAPTQFPTAGATNLVLPVTSQNDWDTLIAPAGFQFRFADIVYTKIAISTNGWIALIPSSVSHPVPSLAGSFPINQLSNNTTGYPIIAPLWDDLSSSLITWNYTVGSLWVRWTCKWNNQNATAATSLFWINLDTGDNSITIYYANNTTYVPTMPSASIGIAGICPGDYYSVFYNGINTYVDSTSEDSTIGSVAHPFNQFFKFTPVSWNDECASSKYLGNISNCFPYNASNHHSTVNTQGTCSPNDSNDVWFSYYKPAGISGVRIMTMPDSCHSVSGTTVEVFENCISPIGCGTTSVTYPDFGEVQLYRPDTVAETLYVRVTSDSSLPGKYLICAYNDSNITSLEKFQSGQVDPLIYNHGKTVIIDNKDISGNGQFELYNLQGKKLKSGRINSGKNEIHCDELPNGIYLVKIELGERSITRKLKIEY